MSELKQCPFCGTLKQTVYRNGARYFQVRCDCGILQNPYIYEKSEDAIEAWNRRAE